MPQGSLRLGDADFRNMSRPTKVHAITFLIDVLGMTTQRIIVDFPSLQNMPHQYVKLIEEKKEIN